MKKRISFSVIIIVAVLLIGTVTALAAGVEDINAMLYKIWPEAARALRPLNLSDEAGGIRLDVLSASITDDQLLITYSLTDLRGNRINKDTECDPTVEYPLGEMGGRSGTDNQMVSFDAKKHQAVYAAYSEYASILSPEQVRFGSYLDTVSFAVSGLRSPVNTVTDLWPLMAGQDYTTEAVSGPERPVGISAVAAEGVKMKNQEIPNILNQANNLHIPVTENIELSGIGWIDGNLHVQLHVSNNLNSVTNEYGNFQKERYLVHMYLVDQQGNDVLWYDKIFEQENPDIFSFISTMWWYEGDEQWIENIFLVQQKDMDQYKICCEITDQIGINEELLQYEWNVSFPMDMIRME